MWGWSFKGEVAISDIPKLFPLMGEGVKNSDAVIKTNKRAAML